MTRTRGALLLFFLAACFAAAGTIERLGVEWDKPLLEFTITSVADEFGDLDTVRLVELPLKPDAEHAK